MSIEKIDVSGQVKKKNYCPVNENPAGHLVHFGKNAFLSLIVRIFLINKVALGEMCSLTGMSLPKDSYTVEFDSHRGQILLQFIIISNNVMS